MLWAAKSLCATSDDFSVKKLFYKFWAAEVAPSMVKVKPNPSSHYIIFYVK